ncbi:MAG: NAD(P)/FAD-dependent oxidoreductase [Cyclobacteriaceae bacterium]
MKKSLSLSLPPDIALQEAELESHIVEKLGISTIHSEDTMNIRTIKRAIDARQRQIKVNLDVEVFWGEQPPPLLQFGTHYPKLASQAKKAIIVGAGPAGMFAALRLIELGIKPILLERGKDVRSRRRDLAAINKEQLVNPNSNYCFGEGGAGTYSDGKLYTRSKKRGDIRRILEIFTAHGAKEEILYDAHPHIGTNKLPQIVQQLRESILKAGGEVYFSTRLSDIIIEQNKIKGAITACGRTFEAEAMILATGHSARDIFSLLKAKNVLIEAKPFALGVRIEHPQQLIDRIQYRCETRPDYMPASSYALVHQALWNGKDKGVFSFCMCPGGFIVPSATAPGEVVVNGMSPSRRNSQFANSGIVVAVELQDIPEFAHFGDLATLEFQKFVEQKACQIAGGGQQAPAQLMTEFVQQKSSSMLLPTSYQPGLVATEIEDVLPPFIAQSLRQGLRAFGKKMNGYLSDQAQLIGVESRTSSPVRIPRDRDSFQHPEIQGLYPCGEGAGYAGGIVSAAMDGERCAEKLFEHYQQKSIR